METEDSLPFSQEQTVCSNPVPEESSPLPAWCLFKMHVNKDISTTPRNSAWSLTLTSSNQNPTRVSPLSHTCYMHRPSQTS
jgi:hypothetical protein